MARIAQVPRFRRHIGLWLEPKSAPWRGGAAGRMDPPARSHISAVGVAPQAASFFPNEITSARTVFRRSCNELNIARTRPSDRCRWTSYLPTRSSLSPWNAWPAACRRIASRFVSTSSRPRDQRRTVPVRNSRNASGSSLSTSSSSACSAHQSRVPSSSAAAALATLPPRSRIARAAAPSGSPAGRHVARPLSPSRGPSRQAQPLLVSVPMAAGTAAPTNSSRPLYSASVSRNPDRHAAASATCAPCLRLANGRHDTRAIQEWLGHRNIRHTTHRFRDFWQDQD